MNHVHLRPFLDSDIYAALKIILSDEVKRTYILPDLSQDGAKQLFSRLMELSVDSGHFVRAISVDGRMVGWLNDSEIQNGSLELGWVVHPDFQNRGYATSAVKLAFEELRAQGYKQVLAGAFASNAASIRVMEKAGMRRLERMDEVEYRGTVHNCVYFSYDL